MWLTAGSLENGETYYVLWDKKPLLIDGEWSHEYSESILIVKARHAWLLSSFLKPKIGDEPLEVVLTLKPEPGKMSAPKHLRSCGSCKHWDRNPSLCRLPLEHECNNHSKWDN